MRDFSELKNNNITSKDHLISEMVQKTGLPKERVLNLYENFALNGDGSLTAINESFLDFLNPKKFNFQRFKKAILDIVKKIANPETDPNKRGSLTNRLLATIKKHTGIDADITTLIEIVVFVLMLKNGRNFNALMKNLNYSKKVTNLFEGEDIDLTLINVHESNYPEVNELNAKEDIRLYESLKVILSRNMKHWGNNYHLTDTYKTIVNYLDTEINELSEMNNVNTVTDNYHMDIIRQLLTTKGLDPMYRSLDVIRTTVPDIQTLVFDMLVLVHSYVNYNKDVIQFVSRNALFKYEDSLKMLYSAISSSRISSKIIQRPTKEEVQSEAGSGFLVNFLVDTTKFNTFENPVTTFAAADMVHIVKACSPEFNLKIRSIINRYVTNTINLLASTEKVIIRKNQKQIYY